MSPRHFNPRALLGCLLASLFILVHLFAQSESDFDRGLADFRAGDYVNAAKLFAAAEAASPGKTDALLFEAKCQIHFPDFPGAEKSLRGYIVSHPDSSDALYLLGFVLNRENHPAESLATYTKAAAITRPASDDLKIVALDYVLLNDYPDAIKWLEKAVEFDPKNVDAWYFLGRAYYTRSRLIEARNAFQKVLALDPHNARAENNLGLIFESNAQPEAALDAYRKSIAWQEQNLQPSEQPYVNLGNLLMEQGQLDQAAAPLEKAVALAPNDAFCRLKLGIVYLRTRQLDKAQRELEKATQLQPNYAEAHYQLGRLYKEIHQLDRAKAEFARTAELQNRSVHPEAVAPAH